MKYFTKSEWMILVGLFELSFIPVSAGIFRLVELGGGVAMLPVNPRVNAGIALKYPHLECEINRDGIDTPIGSMVNDEFAILTEMSHEVELASVKLNNDNELEFEYKQT